MNEHEDLLSTEATDNVAFNEDVRAIKKEEWRPVAGYECYFAVSNLGHIYNFKQRKLATQMLDKHGYYRVHLSKPVNGKFINVHVLSHRVIAEAFLPNPYNKPCIDHISTERTDNRIDNLRWVTYLENARNELTLEHMRVRKKLACKDPEYRQRVTNRILSAASKPEAKIKRKVSMSPYMVPVMCIETGETFSCGADAAAAYGLHRNAIYNSLQLYMTGGQKRVITQRNGKPIYHFKPL